MKKITRFFNLVEVIMAMGIIIVCLTTILGLFSAGMKISEDATLNAYSTIIVEQMGGLVEMYPEVHTEIPTVNTTPQSDGYEYPGSYNSSICKSAINSNDWSTILAAENLCTTAIDPQDPFLSRVYYNSSATSGTQKGLLKVEFASSVANGEVVDFTAWVRMWWTSSSDQIYGSDNQAVDIDKTLIIEVTWAGKTPYQNRILSGQIIQVPWRFQP